MLAALAWGMGFAWAKDLGTVANAAAGLTAGATLGPVVIVALRFTAAAALWFAVVPGSRRGWTWTSVRRALVIGCLMAAGVITQHLGLDVSDEATVAFLTNLTVVFVPLMMAALFLRWPSLPLMVALVLATSGIWLLTGARPGGFGRGEWLTLGCAVLFSAELIVIDRLVKRDSPARMTGGMFATVACCCWPIVFTQASAGRMDVGALLALPVLIKLALLVCFTTVMAFGLMTYFQPKLDPTRAAIIYLFEPIFAALYAYVLRGTGMTLMALTGAGLILLANVVAEAKFFRRRKPR